MPRFATDQERAAACANIEDLCDRRGRELWAKIVAVCNFLESHN